MKGVALAVALVCWQADAAGLETAKWQAEIDAAAARGGGQVVVPPGVHPVGQLDLRSNVELHLEEGSVLQGAVGLEHYRVVRLPYSEGTWSAIVMGLNVTNVAVTGRGVIHGQGDKWPQPENYGGLQEGRRARGLFFANSKDIRLEGFTLKDSACWGIVLKCCDGMHARNVTIDSHANANNDGFDVEAKNVVIENCDVDSGDDAFCIKSNNPDFSVENVLVRDCVARSHCNALKLGTASHGVMRNIRFERCTVAAPRRDFTDGRRSSPKFGKGWFYRAPGPSAPKGYPDYPNGVCGCAMAVEDVDGGRVVDVSFEDISFSGCIVPIFVRGGLRTGRATGAPANTLCDFDRVSFRNVRGTAEGVLPSTVSGVDACRPRNVSFEDVAIVCRGEGRSDRPFDEIGPEFADAYPEASMFKDLRLPAFGLYADRADGVTLRNVRFELAKGEPDRREPVVFAKTVAAVAGTGRPVPKNVPELMLCENGSRVTGIRDWEDVRRPELLNVFSREVYGVRPVERPPRLAFEVVKEDPEALGGTAVLKVVRIVYGGPYGERDFRAIAFFPKTGRPAPTFVYIALSGDGLNTHRMDGERQEWPKFTEERWPVQKILARGYATVAFRVTDLAPDDDCGFGIGAWRCFETRESRREDSWGALSVWAWGASRVADWLETEPLADSARLATVGLSRCGKTSILACATDTRFAMCCTSGAGCCGDKLNHVELAPVQDEHIAQILRFRHWFSRRFDKYAGRDLDLPFDQHELLALIAPRLLCVAAASEDDGAGPYGQFLSASFASPAWELYGKRGLVAAEFPRPGQALQDGSVSFHLRKGDHDLTAFDWNLFMDFADRNGWTKPIAATAVRAGDVELLEDLIRIPSVSADVTSVNRAVRFMRDRLFSDGMTCRIETMEDGREVLFASNDGSVTPDVLLSAHLDVVEAQDPSQFVPRRENGRIYGRGASDCKEHCVLAARLMRELKGKVSVGCIFGSDEETGGASTAFMLDRGYGAKKLVIVMDSEQYAITTRQKGLAHYRITKTHPPRHGGMVKGPLPNAAVELTRGYLDLAAEFPACEDGSWRDLVSLVGISGGASKAELRISLRAADFGSWERLEGLVREKIDGEIVCLRKGDPVRLDEKDPVLCEFRERMRAKWPDRNVDFYHLNSSTDARHLQRLGLPMLIIGVDARGAHSPDEHVILSSLDEYADLLKGYLVDRP